MTDAEIAMFSYPAAGDPGGPPQYAFRGPMYTGIDLSMFKNFKLPFLGEQGNVQFRAEVFNLLNHPSFGIPNGTFSSGSFGQYSSTVGNPRIFQFALKVSVDTIA